MPCSNLFYPKLLFFKLSRKLADIFQFMADKICVKIRACLYNFTLFHVEYQQTGTDSSRRHIQGSKIAKGLQVSIYSTRKSKNKKNGLTGAPKKVSVPKKIERGTLWSRPVWYVTRENRKNVFGSVR